MFKLGQVIELSSNVALIAKMISGRRQNYIGYPDADSYEVLSVNPLSHGSATWRVCGIVSGGAAFELVEHNPTNPYGAGLQKAFVGKDTIRVNDIRIVEEDFKPGHKKTWDLHF